MKLIKMQDAADTFVRLNQLPDRVGDLWVNPYWVTYVSQYEKYDPVKIGTVGGDYVEVETKTIKEVLKLLGSEAENESK